MPEGILVVRDQKPNAEAPEPDRFWVIQDNPALSGTDIKNPEQNFDETRQPVVTFNFTDKGRDGVPGHHAEIAQRGVDNALPTDNPSNASQHFAIVLDDELISAPYINYQENPDGIDGSTGAQISGSFTIPEAQDLARILQIGALPIRLELVSRSQVSATLGAQALDEGLVAGAVGFAIVALFLIVFYRVLGLIAVTAMAIYALYFYAVVKLIPITLTLPGIAGLILTLGVAADANIVIFERVKEEMRAGRSVGQAISAGYKKGLTAIIDANIVTVLVAFILFVLASAGVQGFALTLAVGVILSMFTAVLATQAILYALRGTRVLRSRAALGARDSKPVRFDFMGKSRWFFSMSGVILLVCALAIAINGLNFGIDFEGGTRITAPLTEPASIDQVRDTLGPVGLGDAEIQTVDNPELGDNVVQISAEELSQDEVDARQQRARRASSGWPTTSSFESIGASFGESVARKAIYAIIASLIVVSVYITLRFQWKFAVPVLIALMHDLLITGGVYALLGREVSASTVAALLTILGFSLYDTIVVFDRIRENIPRMPNAAFSQIYNRSMSEVIVRSLATSFCAGLPILALMLFGGETLQDFAFALLIGTLSGTYSSVFIAGPVLTLWKEREPVYHARAERIRQQFGGVIPAYAVATAGAPVDVAPKETKRGRRPDRAGRPVARRVEPGVRGDGARPRDRGGRAAAPARRGARRQPPGRRPPRALARRAGERPAAAGGRRRQAEEAAQPPPREAALMAALVWVMMGLALWHFTIFLPDHFWAGIVGAFLGAVLGSLIFGFVIHGFTRPRPERHQPAHAPSRRSPARCSAWASSTGSACARSARTRPTSAGPGGHHDAVRGGRRPGSRRLRGARALARRGRARRPVRGRHHRRGRAARARRGRGARRARGGRRRLAARDRAGRPPEHRGDRGARPARAGGRRARRRRLRAVVLSGDAGAGPRALPRAAGGGRRRAGLPLQHPAAHRERPLAGARRRAGAGRVRGHEGLDGRPRAPAAVPGGRRLLVRGLHRHRAADRRVGGGRGDRLDQRALELPAGAVRRAARGAGGGRRRHGAARGDLGAEGSRSRPRARCRRVKRRVRERLAERGVDYPAAPRAPFG